ncbi:hypothetical protein FRC02_005682 [Tulasnella sp. 418]|nr:hypothetical protein FRC02_005682 [Tulasnella sp. 418]
MSVFLPPPLFLHPQPESMASLFRRHQSPAVQVTPPVEHQTLTSRFSVDVPKTSSWFSSVKRQSPIAEETNAPSIAESNDGDQPIRTSNATDDYVRVTRTQPDTSTQPQRVSEHTPRSNNPDNANATPLTTLYLVSGLPKSPHTWTLADSDSVSGVHHSEGAVGRWWRAEVLGSTVTPGVGGKKKGKRNPRGTSSANAGIESAEGKAGLAKGDLGKMLSKSLKLSFTREVEIIASTLQPASTVHTFTFSIPSSSSPGLPSDLRSSVFSSASAASGTVGDRSSGATFPYIDPTLPRPSSSYLGPSSNHLGIPSHHHRQRTTSDATSAKKNETPYYGVCLTVWSHADEERSVAIRRTLETAARQRAHKSSMSSMTTSIAPSTAPSNGPNNFSTGSPIVNRPRKRSAGTNAGPWSNDGDDFESETDGGAITESEADFPDAGAGAGASTLFLPQNTVFWLPYALTLVSRHPIYDLMRDYLTLSWARFSKDVQSHTLQIAKILEAPAPRAGDIVRIDAGTAGETLEVICRFPGGLDFGRGLVDVNFTMWPLFRCLNLDNILTLCEIALAPTGRILFLSRHPAILGIAVSTLKYLVELRGWNGVALPNLHARDARIYLEDPGPWILAMSTEARYCVRPSPEVCICDLYVPIPSIYVQCC